MLGRVRTCSLSSLEVLEMERTPKLLKDDSLSIYEKTLLKLQQGAQRDIAFTCEESMNTDASHSMAAISSNETSVAVNASTASPTSTDEGQSMISLKAEPHGSKLSVVYMFSRYKTSRKNNMSSSDGSPVTPMEDDCSSADASPGYNPQLQQNV